MNRTLETSTRLPNDEADYWILLPPAIALAMIAALISVGVLVMTYFNKRLQTVNHMLICNTCVWSIFCTAAQTNNYAFVLFFDSITSDMSCRWRAYLGYTTIAGVIYSYTAQAVSRLFFVFFSQKFPSLITFKAHIVLIVCQWLMSFSVALPAIVTEDIFYRSKSLCWVTHLYMMHVVYTFVGYYFVPTLATWIIYICVFYRVKRSSTRTNAQPGRRAPNRDLELFRNLLILLSIYLSGGLPTSIYIFTKVYFFYSTGIIFVSLTMVVEKAVTLVLDREIRMVTKKILRIQTDPVVPVGRTNEILTKITNRTTKIATT